MTNDLLQEVNPVGVVCTPAGQRRLAEFRTGGVKPVVSCVMVSRGNERILRHSVNCFINQTYDNRELIIILQNVSNDLVSYLDSISKLSLPIFVHTVPPSLKLGDLRNMAISRAHGDLICQWDDDDLHHPGYLEVMVGFMNSNKVGAAFLDRWIVWWPSRKLFYVSMNRIWEGSMVARRSLISIYPNLSKGEDMFVMKRLVNRCPFVLVSAPHLYVYTVTGRNTWDEKSMELMAARGSQHCSPEDYSSLFSVLNSRYDVSDYERYCLEGGRRAAPSLLD